FGGKDHGKNHENIRKAKEKWQKSCRKTSIVLTPCQRGGFAPSGEHGNGKTPRETAAESSDRVF
ncbi:MAG: hypothetical protein AAFP69_22165, partial [Planctomycetota bacterium]